MEWLQARLREADARSASVASAHRQSHMATFLEAAANCLLTVQRCLPDPAKAALPREEEAPMGSGVDAKNAALVAEAAEKVAKAEPLELLKKGDEVRINGEPHTLQEDDELWRERDGTAFESALQVDPEHGVSPVKLIDMRFIIALGELGGTMVRRQDLPKEAFIDLDTLKRLPGPYGSSLPIISISHPWQQPDHPDPKEVNLQLLAKVMKLMLEFFKQRGMGTFAVFFE